MENAGENEVATAETESEEEDDEEEDEEEETRAPSEPDKEAEEEIVSKIKYEPLPGDLGGDIRASLAADNEMYDITLVGSDGGRVPAVRFILAARSKVFKRMLMGNFSESDSKEIELAYPSVILEYLVQYCCSDEIVDFREFIDDDSRNWKIDEAAEVEMLRNMVRIVVAADFFELVGLQNYIEVLLQRRLNGLNDGLTFSFDACVIWDESLKSSSLPVSKLQSLALKRMDLDPTYCLLDDADENWNERDPGVLSLSAESLLRLVEEDMLRWDTFTLFEAILLWSEAEQELNEECDTVENQVVIARECVARLDLRLVPPIDLLGTVYESGLLDSDTILKIMNEQQNMRGSIYVCGAGSSFMNGWYSKSTVTLNGKKAYVMDGTLGRGAVKFFLYKARAGGWRLSTPPLGEEVVTESSSDRIFYSSKSLNVDAKRWKKEPNGLDPAPRVVLVPKIGI